MQIEQRIVQIKSTSNFLFMHSGDPILWASQNQDAVALSSSESELASATEECRQMLWLEKLLNDFEIKNERPI